MIIMNTDRPLDTTYILHCPLCDETWVDNDIEHIRNFVYKHGDWYNGRTEPLLHDDKLEMYEYKRVKTMDPEKI